MQKFKNYIIAVISVVLLSELYFYPFQGEFRFSAGVLALNLILLLYDDLKEIYLGAFTAIFILALRVIINLFSTDYMFYKVLTTAIPASAYYLLYCILIYLFNFKKNKDLPIISIFTLFAIDISCNIFESILRNSFNIKLLSYIILIAFFRSIVAYSIFLLFKNEGILIRKKEHQKRYVELNSIISNIQSEMFYLNKSMKDIENVMSKSYLLYEDNKDNKELSKPALDIAKDIHEIKKDYYRVLIGLESFMESFEEDAMSFKDISSIISVNIDKYINKEKKDIDFQFKFVDNYKINNFYLIFTILNNLIINSIDASKKQDIIKVKQETQNKNLILTVSDTGVGIEKDILPFIFNPGFTTKFDIYTGNASTGIGLSHIKNIVESLNGTIDIQSKVEKGTIFTILIPLNSILL